MPSGAHLTSPQFNKDKPHTSLDMPYTAPGPYGFEGTIGDALAEYAIATEYKGEEWRETKGAGLGGTTTYETPAFWSSRKDMIDELNFELGDSQHQHQTPEDEWGITDDDGSGRGGSKEDYEDFDFEGDDW